jgi:hypothetical protein
MKMTAINVAETATIWGSSEALAENMRKKKAPAIFAASW